MLELDFCLKRRANEQHKRFSLSDGRQTNYSDGVYTLLEWTKCPDCPYHAGISVTIEHGVVKEFTLKHEGMCVKEN